jgi:L-cysteine/cystine lyase
VNVSELRAQFPVFEKTAYLNAGTNGPISLPYREAVRAELELESIGGRSGPDHWARLNELASSLRGSMARLLGTSADQVALTRSTTDGATAVLTGFALDGNSVILTSDEEHAGLLGPLAGARARSGAQIRLAPFNELAEHVDTDVSLIAVSHVSWMTGSVAPLERLAATGVPLLVDGAQALGARPIDVEAIGCSFYAASGQKWLCGPSGTGALFVADKWIDRLGVPHPRYMTLAESADPLELVARAGAARFDSGELAGPDGAASLAALGLLEEVGWDAIFDHSAALATRLRESLPESVRPIPGDASNLVVFEVEDAERVTSALHDAGVTVRALPGRQWVRASLGGWNAESDLERLLAAL